jgi:ABC-type molybdate transport system substrate-binding protein
MEDTKIKISIKPIEIPPMIDVNLKELANKVNQIIFVLNEMGITIMKEDVLANAVWKKILEENK